MRFCTQCGQKLQPGSVCACLGTQTSLRFSCDAEGLTLLGLYLKTLLLSIVTLGVYSFWGRTEIRQYLYGSTFAGDDRFAWHGTGKELLVGWLKAMAFICTFYLLYFGLSVADKKYGPMIGLIFFYLILFAITPYIVVAALRYRLSRTSLRGIHFVCSADAREFAKLYYKGLGLTLLTLGFYSPWFGNNIRGYLTSHISYGDQPFAYDGNGKDLFGAYVLFIFLLIPTLYLSAFWFAAKQERYGTDHTTWRSARLHSTLRGRSLLWLFVSNLALIVFTIGLGAPWARLRSIRLYCGATTVEGFIGFEDVQQRTMAAGATGETVGALLEVESDVGGGLAF